MRLVVLALGLFGATQPATQEPAEYGWFVPQGPRVQTLGELSSLRAIVDENRRSTAIIFSNPSGNPVTGGQRVMAVRFNMTVDCASGSYRLTDRIYLSREGDQLASLPIEVAENFFGPLDLITAEVCGGDRQSARDSFGSVADYVDQSETRPRAPIARIVGVSRPD